jgi:hypothetical protein
MLSLWQRRTVFAIFMLATAGFLLLEGYLVWSMINGLTLGKGVASAIGLTVLGGCGILFKQIVEANFIGREALLVRRLHQTTTERSQIVDRARSGQSEHATKKALVTESLRFAEHTLNGWIPGSHLEFCVFIDAEQPMLFSYYDSQHDIVARSMESRKFNPDFYIEKGYEVTKLLRTPSSHPAIISDTHADGARYRFTTDQQRRQIRSTLLLSLDLQAPIAMVVSSNEPNAFNPDDPQLMSFIRYVGETIRCDLLQGNFVGQLRQHLPEAFTPQDVAPPALLEA